MADYVHLIHPQHPSSSRARGQRPESYRNSRAEGGSIFWRCVAHFLSVASTRQAAQQKQQCWLPKALIYWCTCSTRLSFLSLSLRISLKCTWSLTFYSC